MGIMPYQVTIWGEGKEIPLYQAFVLAESEQEAKAQAMRSLDLECAAHAAAPLPKITRVECEKLPSAA